MVCLVESDRVTGSETRRQAHVQATGDFLNGYHGHLTLITVLAGSWRCRRHVASQVLLKVSRSIINFYLLLLRRFLLMSVAILS